MAKNRYFTNHKVFWQAAKNVQWTTNQALAYCNAHPSNPNLKYDARNIMDLAGLIVDLSKVPENQKEAYFKTELEKMWHAFNTPSKDNPNRADNEAVKPYIKAMFDNLAIDLNKIDYNDVNQVTKSLATMRSTQMIATLVANFPEATMQLYPTHEQMAKVDAVGGRAYMTYVEGRVAMTEEGLDGITDYVQFMPGKFKTNASLVEAEVGNAVFGSTIEGKDSIMIDPTISDFTTKQFLGESFSIENISGQEPFEYHFQYTNDNYYVDFMERLATPYVNTSLEHMMTSAMVELNPKKGDPDKMKQMDLLLIDGKPMSEIIEEKQAELNGDEKKAKLEAGKILHNALLDGRSKVSLLSASINRKGEMVVTDKDVKVDLDKLNRIDRTKNYSLFRRFLDTIGIARIPEKYPSNQMRDDYLKHKNDRVCDMRIEDMKNKMVNVYNKLPRPYADKVNIVDMIPKATRMKVEDPDRVAKNVSNREPVEIMEFKKKKYVAVEPVKKEKDKVIQQGPPFKK